MSDRVVVKSLTVSYRMSLSCSAWPGSMTHTVSHKNKHITHKHAQGLKPLSSLLLGLRVILRGQ